MRVSGRVRRGVGVVVEVCDGLAGSHGAGRMEEAAGAVEVWDSDGLAVPAGALAVDAAAGFPGVLPAGPFEAVAESHFLDLVVVVDEDFFAAQVASLGRAVGVVALWVELVRVPG